MEGEQKIPEEYYMVARFAALNAEEFNFAGETLADRKQYPKAFIMASYAMEELGNAFWWLDLSIDPQGYKSTMVKEFSHESQTLHLSKYNDFFASVFNDPAFPKLSDETLEWTEQYISQYNFTGLSYEEAFRVIVDTLMNIGGELLQESPSVEPEPAYPEIRAVQWETHRRDLLHSKADQRTPVSPQTQWQHILTDFPGARKVVDGSVFRHLKLLIALVLNSTSGPYEYFRLANEKQSETW